MEARKVSDGIGKTIKRGTHGYGLGGKVRLSGTQEQVMWWPPKKRQKIRRKTTKNPPKKQKQNRLDGPRGPRPFSPSRSSLRTGLSTRSTPPFAAHDDKRSSCALYHNHVKNSLCENNFFSVLLAVLRYCPGSTAHRCPLTPLTLHFV